MEIGCQLNCWPLGPDFGTGFVSAVTEAASIGYAGVETNWRMLHTWEGREEELREILDRAGVRLSALFFGAGSAGRTALLKETADALKTAAFLHRFGATHMMVGGGRATDDRDLFERVCRHFTELGKQVFLEYGVKACYHLHRGAVAATPDEIERMMDLTDERYWHLCPDTGIMAGEGHDVKTVLERYRERIPYVHFKDWDAAEGWTLLGRGQVDHAGILRKLQEIGFEGWLISENESGCPTLTPTERQAADRDWLRRQGY